MVEPQVNPVSHDIVFAANLRPDSCGIAFNLREVTSAAQKKGRNIPQAPILVFVVLQSLDPINRSDYRGVRQNCPVDRESRLTARSMPLLLRRAKAPITL